MLTVTLNPALDVCATVDVIEPDRKMHCRDVILGPGGGGVNVARVAHRMGVDVTAAVFLAPLSDERFLALLGEERVRVEVLEVDGAVRESLTFVEESTGRQYRFVLPGPFMARERFEAGLARLSAIAHEHPFAVVSGSTPPGLEAADVARVVACLRAAGATVFADTGGEALGAVAAEGVALMKPSVRELSVSAGETLSSHDDIERAARTLLARGPNHAVLVSLGERGALLVRTDGPTAWFHAPRVLVASTVGAGDSLVAGIAVATTRGADIETAVRYGVAAGTAATLGSGTGLCQVDDVERLLPQVMVTGISE